MRFSLRLMPLLACGALTACHSDATARTSIDSGPYPDPGEFDAGEAGLADGSRADASMSEGGHDATIPTSDGGALADGSSCVPCGSHGQCVAGACQCMDGFGGAACDQCVSTELCPKPGAYRVEQWGEGDVDEVWGLAGGATSEALVAGRTNASLSGQPYEAGYDLFVSGRFPNAASSNWTRELGTQGDDDARGILRDATGNVFAAGRASGKLSDTYVGSTDAILIKWNPDHSLAWKVQWGSPAQEWTQDLAQDNAGNFVACGWTTGNVGGSNAGGFDAYVSKLSPTGQLLWSVQFGSIADDYGSQVAVDSGGNVYLAGTAGDALPQQLPAGQNDIFVAKISAAGAVQWVRQWGTDSADGGLDVAFLTGGDLLLSGYSEGSLPAATGSGGAFLARLDGSGIPRWTEQFGANPRDYAQRIALGKDDTVYIGGNTFGNVAPGAYQGLSDMFVQARKIEGPVLWTSQVGTSGQDTLNAIAVAADGTIYAGGSTSGAFPGFSTQGTWDNVLVKLTP